MNLDKLERLQKLKDQGAITEEEYQTLKSKVINGDSNFEIPNINLNDEKTQKTYVTALHLSVLLGSLVPWLGYVAPFVLWYVKKDSIPRIDRHGRVVLNWVLSSLVISVLGFILIPLLGFGLLVLGGLWVANILFSIIGAIRANDGILWPYPFSFNFFNVPKDEGKLIDAIIVEE